MTQNTRTNTNFPLELARRLAEIKWPATYDFLYYHQNIARTYFEEETTRGLLIYHETGMGKSVLAASLAMDALFPQKQHIETARATMRQVIVLLAKSLADNMRDAVKQYIAARTRGTTDDGPLHALAALPSDKRDEWIERNFSFVTMNASNMLAQMSRATQEFVAEDEEDLLLDLKAARITEKLADLNGKLLIVDEAHNLFRTIVNGSRNAANLYNMIMGARDLKIAFLTGTPIASHPFEMSVCFNMLAGDTIFPVQYNDFTRLFVSHERAILNRAKFQNRIFGLVSYVNYKSTPGVGTADILANIREFGVGSVQPAPERAKQHVEFPEEYPLVIVNVAMNTEQYDAYIIARERERSEGMAKAMRGSSAIHGSKIKVVIKQPRAFHAKDTPALQKPKSEFSSSYRVHSRQIGNYCPPEEVRRKMAQDGIEKIPVTSILDDIGPIVSPKFSAILERVRKHHDQLGFIYSQFVGLGGLAALARFLDQNGLAKKYAIISGEVAPDERTSIVERFCAPTNMHAEDIQLLLVSSTGAEGLDLKNVRHVHILEPYWNFGRIKQVKARAVRNGSHIDLPPEERNVTIYMYIAVAPQSETNASDLPDSKSPSDRSPSDAPNAAAHMQLGPARELTSDEELYTSARKSQMLIESFERAIQEVSIECAINHTIADRPQHCRICAPTRARLFTENIESDILTSDPCKPVTSARVHAKKISVGSENFFYREANPDSVEGRLYGYEAFAEDQRIRAWRKLAPNDVRYPAIIAAIVDANAQK